MDFFADRSQVCSILRLAHIDSSPCVERKVLKMAEVQAVPAEPDMKKYQSGATDDEQMPIAAKLRVSPINLLSSLRCIVRLFAVVPFFVLLCTFNFINFLEVYFLAVRILQTVVYR